MESPSFHQRNCPYGIAMAMLLLRVESCKLQVASCRCCRLIVVSQRGKRKAALFGSLVSLSVSLLAAFCGHISAAWLLMSIRLPNSDDMLSIFVSWPLKLLVGRLVGWSVAQLLESDNKYAWLPGLLGLGKRVNTNTNTTTATKKKWRKKGDGETDDATKVPSGSGSDRDCSPVLDVAAVAVRLMCIVCKLGGRFRIWCPVKG